MSKAQHWQPCRCYKALLPCAAHAPPPLPQVAQLSPCVTRVLGRNPGPFALTGTNLYLVGTGAERILVDVGEGKPGVLQDLLQTMQQQGCERLSQVVITHWHFDHIGGVPELLEHFGDLMVRKYMPKEGTASGEETSFWDPGDLLSRLHVQELLDGEELTCEGATLRVLFTPGHANDHVCLFLEEERALFTGDVLGWGTGFFQELQPYMRSLKRMAAQAAEVLYPAHGPTIAGAAASAAWLEMYISHREERIRQVEKALQVEGLDGLDLIELVKRVYKAQPDVLHSPNLLRGAFLNTQHVLDFLHKEGCIEQQGTTYVWVQGAKMLENVSRL